MDITQTLQLVQRAQSGDEDALDRVFARYYERVRKVVRARMGARLRRRFDSGDVLQQTFIVAVRKFDGFEMRNEAALINWLSRIAENQIRGLADQVDTQKDDLDREVPLIAGPADHGAPGFDLPDPQKSPTEQAVDREEEELLERALDELEETYRELIIQRSYAGLSWGEIASELHMPSPDAARMNYGTAKARLVAQVRIIREREAES